MNRNLQHLHQTSNTLQTYFHSSNSLSKLSDSIEVLSSALINNDTFKALQTLSKSLVHNNRLSQLAQEYINLNNSFVNNPALTELSRTLQTIKNSSVLNNKLTQFIDTYNTVQAVLKKNPEYMKIYNAIEVLQNCYSANLEQILFQSETSLSAIELAVSQQRLINKLEAFNFSENSNNIIETISESSLNEQLEIIEKEPESNFKQYLRQNHLAILSLILSIVFFIWQNCNDVTVEQNNKIISLLEQSSKTQTELLNVQQDRLSEEQTQTELIKIETELLNEMLIEIRDNLNNNKIAP